jgi:serine protease Do
VTIFRKKAIEDLPDLVEEVIPAVVHVAVSGPTGDRTGSGFFVAPLDGTQRRTVVITNEHVVHGGSKVKVRLYDDTEFRAAVWRVDAATDLAFLRVDAQPLSQLELRPLKEIRVGEPVMAIGSPYGLAGTVTTGVVSALDRTRWLRDGLPMEGMIQTDALINPGNSGGPLIGLDGRVIGVNDQRAPDEVWGGSSGIGFAISSEMVRTIYEEFLRDDGEEVKRATIGARIQLRPFTTAERAQWKQKAGAIVVADPLEASPARAAGLHEGDVIIALDGNTVDEPGDVFRLLDRSRIGEACTIDYVRQGKRECTQVVPIERLNRR